MYIGITYGYREYGGKVWGRVGTRWRGEMGGEREISIILSIIFF